ncbi:MAG: cysteine desulfurase [Alphaproteobacteria bacterium]|jgi:cysteine desulfurase/selenocysteine lyase|nr:cysteine desulfurase [Alphaproteobacteria bacterium]MDP6818053.1 cysteine desulfurase [Alphaproteobacteria bacterium]
MRSVATISENSAFDVARLRADFPILAERVYDKPLVFLDSAASAQKPQCVIDAVSHCYSREYANIHRGVYYLSERATQAYEDARVKVQRFINAASEREIIFTKSTTEAINLVAASYGGATLKEGDEIILSHLEHHANIVPWQLLRQRIGIEIKVVPIDERGNFLLEEFEKLLSPRTRLVAVSHTSNALGTITPAAEIVRLAHAQGTPVLLDGAQSVVHGPIDVQALDVDFFAFSGHKLYGPSGIGVLYGKADLLAAMPPYQGGGDMIKRVTFEKTEFADIPGRFEAGTPHIAGAYGFAAAIDYVSAIGMEAINAHERELLDYATARLQEINSLRFIGTADDKAGIVSFELDGVHAHDIGTILDREGIAVRVGHHCAQPLMDRFGITGTVRASFGLYNDKADIDALVRALGAVREIFG